MKVGFAASFIHLLIHSFKILALDLGSSSWELAEGYILHGGAFCRKTLSGHHVCACIWRPEDTLGCHSLGAVHLEFFLVLVCFEIRSATGLELTK